MADDVPFSSAQKISFSVKLFTMLEQKKDDLQFVAPHHKS